MLQSVNGPLDIQTKGSRVDFVTDADLACDAIIRETLSGVFPDHVLITEETITPDLFQKAKESCWIVDPIDGTTNFTHGYPYSSVSIAYCENAIPQVGVILNPFQQEIFYAVRGEGAFLKSQYLSNHALANDTPIHCSQAQSLEESMIATGFAFRRDNPEDTTRQFKKLADLLDICHDIRRAGSAALDMAYVACGRQDAFYEVNLNPWDVAAGWVIIEEAGGKVSSQNGMTLDFTQKRQDLLCSTSGIYTELQNFLLANSVSSIL